jgi:antitoxin component YwqK of YwqJK toxin-antitoxin module
MNPVPFILLAISLPLLLGGCGEKEVNFEELEEREGIYYVSGSDTPYTGKSFTLNENGKKASKRNFKDGKQDGLQTRWYENGQKKNEANGKDGKMDGLYTEWFENGQKKVEANYKDGKMDGLVVEWHENGQKKGEATFKDDEPISGKFWNSKGEPVDTYEEGLK